MANKITKKTVNKIPKEEVVVKEKSTKIRREDALSGASNPKAVDIAQIKADAKKEAMQELMGGSDIVEIDFQKTIVPNSDVIAKKLNKGDKRATVWNLDEGQKIGDIEEVKINGAVAQIPKGKLVYVPSCVADMIEGYLKAEKEAGKEMLADRNKVEKGVSIQDALNM